MAIAGRIWPEGLDFDTCDSDIKIKRIHMEASGKTKHFNWKKIHATVYMQTALFSHKTLCF